jgi:hypothetical protein
MPAIQLARLKLQAAHLRDSFSRPEAFVRGLHAMLDFYADRTHRPGQSGEPQPLIPAYHAPEPVLRRIGLEVAPLLASDPGGALVLIDALWAQPNLECRLLAASLLGSIPAPHSGAMLQRIQAWAQAEKNDRLLAALLGEGLTGYRLQAVEPFLHLLDGWLHSENLHEQRMGLVALLPLIEVDEYHNLPVLFRLITSHLRSAHPDLRPDLLSVLEALSRHSPIETAHFLKENLASSSGLDTPWLTRQILPVFTPEIRRSLREALRQIGK